MAVNPPVNPFAPPQSPVLAAEPGLARRPVSILLLQVGLVLLFFAFATGFIRGVLPFVNLLLRPGVQMIAPWGLIGAIALRLAVIAGMGFTFWAVARRRPYGRWLSGLFLAALAAAFFYAATQPGGDPLFPVLAQAGQAARRWGPMLAILIVIATLVWARSIIASEKSRRYFGLTPPRPGIPAAPPES